MRSSYQYQRCIVLVFIVVMVSTIFGQKQNSCKVSPLSETATNKFNGRMTKFSEFFEQNDLQKGHEQMRKVVQDLKAPLSANDNMPLLSYVVKHREFLQKDQDAAMTALENKYSMKLDDLKRSLANFESRMEDRLNQAMEDFKIFIKDKMQSCIMGDDPLPISDNRNIPVAGPNIKPFDCLGHLEAGQTNDGSYTIYPQGREFRVYCDMTTDGGGWTVFLNRHTNKRPLSLRENWLAYKNGFGSPPGEYWLDIDSQSRDITTRVQSMNLLGSDGITDNTSLPSMLIMMNGVEIVLNMTTREREEASGSPTVPVSFQLDQMVI